MTTNRNAKYVVLETISTGARFWSTNSENNTHSAKGELWYKEIAFVNTEEEAIALLDKRFNPKEEFKYVWLDLNTGEFSNSWTENDQKLVDQEMMNTAKEKGWKLIKYKCINDEKFELYNMMKITSQTK